MFAKKLTVDKAIHDLSQIRMELEGFKKDPEPELIEAIQKITDAAVDLMKVQDSCNAYFDEHK